MWEMRVQTWFNQIKGWLIAASNQLTQGAEGKGRGQVACSVCVWLRMGSVLELLKMPILALEKFQILFWGFFLFKISHIFSMTKAKIFWVFPKTVFDFKKIQFLKTEYFCLSVFHGKNRKFQPTLKFSLKMFILVKKSLFARGIC